MKALPYIVAAATATACGVVLFQFNQTHQIIAGPKASTEATEHAAEEHTPSLPTIATPAKAGSSEKVADSADSRSEQATRREATKPIRRAPSLTPSRPIVEIASVVGSLKATQDPLQRRRLFIELVDGLTPENAAEMREEILTLPQNSPEFRDFHYALGQLLGKEAIVSAAETKELDLADSLRGWAGKDPNAAYEWFADRFAEGKMSFNSGGTGSALVSSLATTDLDLATETALGAGAESQRAQQYALWSVANAVAQTNGVDQAAQWAENIPEGDSQKNAVLSVAKIWANKDAEQAFNWALSISDEKLRETTLIQVGRTYVRTDPEKAKQQLQENGISPDALKYKKRPTYSRKIRQ